MDRLKYWWGNTSWSQGYRWTIDVSHLYPTWLKVCRLHHKGTNMTTHYIFLHFCHWLSKGRKLQWIRIASVQPRQWAPQLQISRDDQQQQGALLPAYCMPLQRSEWQVSSNININIKVSWGMLWYSNLINYIIVGAILMSNDCIFYTIQIQTNCLPFLYFSKFSSTSRTIFQTFHLLTGGRHCSKSSGLAVAIGTFSEVSPMISVYWRCWWCWLFWLRCPHIQFPYLSVSDVQLTECNTNHFWWEEKKLRNVCGFIHLFVGWVRIVALQFTCPPRERACVLT